ncbi:MAG: electron transport complex subunit RsxE [Planctomycetota bacterium]
MEQRSLAGEFGKGLLEENAVFVLALGLCPTLAVTTGLKNAAAMGMAVIVVLTCSTVIVSMLRSLIPHEVRIPCCIVVIASFVTMIEIVFKAYLPPAVNQALGIFIPLIVVNCIILNRAESFGYKNGVLRSFSDGLGVSVGFTLAICALAAVREAIGNGTLWGYSWMPSSLPINYDPASIMIQAPGAFLALGLMMGLFNYFRGTGTSAE